VNNRRKQNNISALKTGDVWLEEPIKIREEIESYFTLQFSEVDWDRPTLEGLSFPTVSESEVEYLSRPFLKNQKSRNVL
jgi:hypothetical protein